ncbi:MAG: 50S ribosomal protein L11 methyltransferase [Bradymonadales bacterium]|nr:50S ribosomal protein L11 methyltransferase [Bradymonadales bacterium]
MLLDDPVRMDAYERAIRALVRPGDVVLDVGCGTGILAMLAARCGALRVHAVESTAVAALAAELVAANGLVDRVLVHRRDARRMEPPELVDLVISDFLGRYLIDDGMLPVMAATKRWCKPETRFCPERIRLMLAPVGDFFLRAVDLFTAPIYGLDFSGALPYALNTCYHADLRPEAIMSPPAEFGGYTPPDPPVPFDGTLTFTIARDGRLQALAGWFSANLAPDVVLSTEPGIETHWGQYLFPLPPHQVQAGDILSVHLWEQPVGADSVWHWEGRLARGADALWEFALRSISQLGHSFGAM